LSKKTVPIETDISSSLAFTAGPTAAIALPPQIAVPTDTRYPAFHGTERARASRAPPASVNAMPKSV
jgi:hypothetical protein